MLFPVNSAWRAALEESLVPPLAVTGDRVLLATAGGSVRALSLEDGSPRWSAEAAAGVVTAEGNDFTRRRLEAVGCEVHAIPLREVGENGSGGVTCLTRPVVRA